MKVFGGILAGVMVSIVLTVSGPSRSEDCGGNGTPVQTASSMLAAAEADDWETFVHCFYDELYKAATPAQVDMVVSRFRERWSDETISGLRVVVTMEPQMSDDGRRAEFRLDDGIFTLHRTEGGGWKFRL